MSLMTTTKTQSFAGVIKRVDDKNKLELNSQSFYQHQLNKYKDGEEVTLYLTNLRPKRTVYQNRYYWGVYLPLIAQETGELDLDALHTLFKGKFLTTGIIDVLGEKVRITKSSTDLSTSEFGEFITAIENLTGITAPPVDNDMSNNPVPQKPAWRK